MIKKLGYPVVVALSFVTLGFIFLGVAWDGAASVDFVQGQIPYLLSGGTVGLGLIMVGSSLLLFEAGRRVILRLEERIDRLNEAILLGSINSSNGHAPIAASTASEAAADPDQLVLGSMSFHTQTCRLTEGKDDLAYGSLAEAVARGLKPCRLCDPEAPKTATRRPSRAKAKG